MSTTYDHTPPADARPWQTGWRRAAIAAAALGCIGFAAGYGTARLRPLAVQASALTALPAAHAANLAQHVERLADVERNFAVYRGRLEEADALMRAASALRDGLRAGGSYAGPLAAALAQRGGAEALAPLRGELDLRVDGAPHRAALAAQLDAIALSVLALDDPPPEGWSGRMMRRLVLLLPMESRAARQDSRERAFSAARDAASAGALDAAIVALAPLDAEVAAALADWIEEARRRAALDLLADRVAALAVDFAYH